MVCELCSKVAGEVAGPYSEICRYKRMSGECTVGDRMEVVVGGMGYLCRNT